MWYFEIVVTSTSKLLSEFGRWFFLFRWNVSFIDKDRYKISIKGLFAKGLTPLHQRLDSIY